MFEILTHNPGGHVLPAWKMHQCIYNWIYVRFIHDPENLRFLTAWTSCMYVRPLPHKHMIARNIHTAAWPLGAIPNPTSVIQWTYVYGGNSGVFEYDPMGNFFLIKTKLDEILYLHVWFVLKPVQNIHLMSLIVWLGGLQDQNKVTGLSISKACQTELMHIQLWKIIPHHCVHFLQY